MQNLYRNLNQKLQSILPGCSIRPDHIHISSVSQHYDGYGNGPIEIEGTFKALAIDRPPQLDPDLLKLIQGILALHIKSPAVYRLKADALEIQKKNRIP